MMTRTMMATLIMRNLQNHCSRHIWSSSTFIQMWPIVMWLNICHDTFPTTATAFWWKPVVVCYTGVRQKKLREMEENGVYWLPNLLLGEIWLKSPLKSIGFLQQSTLSSRILLSLDFNSCYVKSKTSVAKSTYFSVPVNERDEWMNAKGFPRVSPPSG